MKLPPINGNKFDQTDDSIAVNKSNNLIRKKNIFCVLIETLLPTTRLTAITIFLTNIVVEDPIRLIVVLFNVRLTTTRENQVKRHDRVTRY